MNYFDSSVFPWNVNKLEARSVLPVPERDGTEVGEGEREREGGRERGRGDRRREQSSKEVPT